jgi:Fe-S cluster biogenesis protein NfuA
MSESATSSRGTEPREQIEDVLATIRPAIRADGGDIELVGFDRDEGLVRLRMVGACHACPMSMMTLKAGIEQRLRMQVPEVRSVEAI